MLTASEITAIRVCMLIRLDTLQRRGDVMNYEAVKVRYVPILNKLYEMRKGLPRDTSEDI